MAAFSEANVVKHCDRAPGLDYSLFFFAQEFTGAGFRFAKQFSTWATVA